MKRWERGPVLGRGDSVLQKAPEGRGGWGVASQEGRRDERGPDLKGLEGLEKELSLCPENNWKATERF